MQIFLIKAEFWVKFLVKCSFSTSTQHPIFDSARSIKKITVSELRGITFEKYHKRIEFVKENSYYSPRRLEKKDLLLLITKIIEKIADPSSV